MVDTRFHRFAGPVQLGALLASIGQPKNAKRTAIAHSVFNITGSCVFIWIIPFFAKFVQFISPKGNEESGAILFEMKAAIEMPEDLFIRAGYSANADIILDSRDNVVSVPESCITFENDSSFVYLATGESSQEFNKKHVIVGLSDGIKIEVLEGLQENDKIRGNQVIETKK